MNSNKEIPEEIKERLAVLFSDFLRVHPEIPLEDLSEFAMDIIVIVDSYFGMATKELRH